MPAASLEKNECGINSRILNDRASSMNESSSISIAFSVQHIWIATAEFLMRVPVASERSVNMDNTWRKLDVSIFKTIAKVPIMYMKCYTRRFSSKISQFYENFIEFNIIPRCQLECYFYGILSIKFPTLRVKGLWDKVSWLRVLREIPLISEIRRRLYIASAEVTVYVFNT